MAIAAATMGVVSTAHAGGFEYPENGSIPMGRGGAYVARASDPSALMTNVAGIVGVPGFQLTLSSNFAVLSHCFQRSGNYEGFNENVTIETTGTVFEGSNYSSDPNTGVGAPYPRVCNEGGIFPAPQLLATYRFNSRVAIGVGVYGPNSIGRQNFPDRVMTPAGLAPSPIRNMLLRSDLLIIHPTVAVAVAPVPWLRFGVAVQPSVAHFQFFTIANSVTGTAQSPNTDIGTEITATGFFMAGNLGVQVIPSPYVSFGAHAHINTNPVLAGRATATVNYYAPNEAQRRQSSFDVTRMEVGLPTQLRFGARFALPRRGHVRINEEIQGQAPFDPMRDEVFDVEADFIYETSSAFERLHIENRGEIDLGANRVAAPSPIDVAHNWRNVWGVRVGGDFNAVPEVLALRAGVSYESGAQSTADAHIDIPAYDMLGLHAGLSLRFRWLTASIAYAHFFTGGNDASRDGRLSVVGTTGALRESDCAQPGTGAGACQVNRGLYTASLDVFNVGLTAHW